jgi:calcineurin-like phosphoesterase family protein
MSKVFVTANLLFGDSVRVSSPYSPRYNVHNIDSIIVNNININISIDDVLIICGGVLGSVDGASWLPAIKCKNIFCIPSEQDVKHLGYIKPYMTIVQEPLRLEDDEIVFTHEYTDSVECTHRDHIGVCGSPYDHWKWMGNILNATVDLWRYEPISIDVVRGFFK